MYEKLYPNYSKVGFDQDDIVSITNIYMLSYMGIYSLRFNKDARERAIEKFRDRFDRDPTEKELYNKDKNNMINFLRQRLQHCSVVCARKARNITVGADRQGYFAFTKDSVPASKEAVLDNYNKLGYRKVKKTEFKEAQEKAKKLGEQTITDKDGFQILSVQILNNGIKRDEYTMWITQHKSSHVDTTPEELLQMMENNRELESYKATFAAMDKSAKRRKLKLFVEQNKNNKYLKEELALARKMLRNSKFMV
jgi:hypothetical protein